MEVTVASNQRNNIKFPLKGLGLNKSVWCFGWAYKWAWGEEGLYMGGGGLVHMRGAECIVWKVLVRKAAGLLQNIEQ